MFSEFALHERLLKAVAELKFVEPTPVQAAAIPLALQGRDLRVTAQTGSGKTAAFVLPILNRLIGPAKVRVDIRAVILLPTRELAQQTLKEVERFSQFTFVKAGLITGGEDFKVQAAMLRKVPDILIGTPGRLLEQLNAGNLDLKHVEVLVLDEADRMLDMGFYDAIADIIEQTPQRRQTLLFSATYPVGIKQLSSKFMRDPQTVKVEALHADSQIEQIFYEISPEQRLEAVVKVLGHFRPTSCVAFCFTKQQVQEVVDHLTAKGMSAVGLHGDLEQRDRDQVLAMFANRSTSVLVATDVAARGLDIDALDMVINVELARDSEIHIHRVGRTGRAGEKGIAVSLVAPSESQRARAIEELQKAPLNWQQYDRLSIKEGGKLLPAMTTLCIGSGRKDKLRPGDILGALTGEAGIPGTQVGKIAIFDFQAYVAVERSMAKQALERLNNGKIKGKSLRVRIL
ncbi:ATP-dependent RNA helicase DbpA [Pseudomonas syringae]|nr:ATP-dependent RNA helicase DbpA [Pseudomonas syringae]